MSNRVKSLMLNMSPAFSFMVLMSDYM